MRRLLFLPVGNRSIASSRYRLYQYAEHSRDYGFDAHTLDWSAASGRRSRIVAAAETLLEAARANVVFIQKRHDEAARWAARVSRRTVFDFDDAIWLSPPGDRRAPEKIPRLMRNLHEILSSSSLILAGNAFLADYARRYNDRVTIVPTVVDLRQYTLQPAEPQPIVTLGWIGSRSTVDYLHLLDDPFARLAERYRDRVRLKVICDAAFEHPTMPVENVQWTLQSAMSEMRSFDMGLMPLKNGDLERGKCGFKLLEYMALGIAAVGAPVGVNPEIIQSGENGLLADNPDDWFDAMSRLIENVKLRQRLALAGRHTVEQSYSLQVMEPVFFNLLRGLVEPQ